jgi:hypothetical protein
MLKTSNCYNLPAVVVANGSDRSIVVATLEKSEQYKTHHHHHQLQLPLSQSATTTDNDGVFGQHHSVFSFDTIELFSGLGNDWPPLQVVSPEATEDTTTTTTMESRKLPAKPKVVLPDPKVSIAAQTIDASVDPRKMPISRQPHHTRRTNNNGLYSQEQWNRLVAYCQFDPSYEPKQTKLSSMEFDLLVGGAKVDADNYYCNQANKPRFTMGALAADDDYCELIEHSETESEEMPLTLKRTRETLTNDAESWFGLDEPLTKVGNFEDASQELTQLTPILTDEPEGTEFLSVLQTTIEEEEHVAFYSMSDADLEDMFLDMLNKE